MMRLKTKALLLMLALSMGGTALAQGTVDDYRRSAAIRGKYSGKMINGDVNVHRMRGESHKFWYSVYNGDSTVYKEVDADQNTVTLLPGNPEQQRRPRWPNGAGRSGRPQRHWMEVPDEKDGWRVSPTDSTLVIFHRDNNLWVGHSSQPRPFPFGGEQQLADDARPLTTNGDSTYYYSAWGSFSPDGRYYATVRIKPAPKHYVYYVEAMPSRPAFTSGSTAASVPGGFAAGATGIQPLLHKQEYAKPGDSLNYRVPVVVEVVTGRVIEPSTDLFRQQYEVSMPSWDNNSRTLTFTFNERGHHTYRLLELDAETGSVRTLIEEKNDKYVNYNRLYRHDFDDGRRILWTSERDGYNHIYLYDRAHPQPLPKGGENCKQVTKGAFYVRDIQYVDEKNGIVYFSANGPTGLRASDKTSAKGTAAANSKLSTLNYQLEEDPYFIHYYKIGLNGKGLTCLTPEEGNHRVTYTDDYAYLIDTYSTVTTPPVTVLRSAKDGKILRTLETADISRLEAEGWKAPEVFVAPGRDGVTPMWGLIQRPSNFDPTKKYPIIEYIYSGPGDQYVPKSFTPWLYYLQDLAELGFIVVQLDAMTTSFRSRAFEEVCYKNLKDAGLPDRIAWIKAAAEKYPYMDIDRVGIYGCSAGGQNAMAAVLWHGDFYKAAYAACGCHDNRMDKIWWNEQWMSYPVDSSYVECSNVENAWRLERPLMLVVGELDDNVDPASTMQVVSALQKAGKDFDLVVLPGAHHTMGETFGEHKRADFFVRHLLGVEPPKWNELQNK